MSLGVNEFQNQASHIFIELESSIGTILRSVRWNVVNLGIFGRWGIFATGRLTCILQIANDRLGNRICTEWISAGLGRLSRIGCASFLGNT